LDLLREICQKLEKMSESVALVFASEGLTTRLLIQTLKRHFDKVLLVEESRGRVMKKFRNRVRRLGFFNSISQAIFVLTVPRLLPTKNRIDELLDVNHIVPDKETKPLLCVENLNHSEISFNEEKYACNAVFINGPGILRKEFLSQFKVPVVNIHTGITPAFRGVHGGYWALCSGRPELFGTTLHFVDAGIDTGGIIDQEIIEISVQDNYTTYPVLQYLTGLRLLEKNLPAILGGAVKIKKSISEESRLWHHPGIFQYLKYRIKKGVK